MKIISHRGNIDSKKTHLENRKEYIDRAIRLGYDVEVDIWRINQNLYLGHDKPEYKISVKWLLNRSDKLWIHCKNDNALFYLKEFTVLNIFFHTNDEFTLCSKNIILVNPFFKTKYYSGILMMPELTEYDITHIINFSGIITDYIKRYEDYNDIIRK